MKTKSNVPIWIKLCLFLIAWFVILAMFEIISQIWFPQYSKEGENIASLVPKTFSHFMQLIGTLLCTWFFTKYVDKIPFITIGFQLKNRSKDIIFGVILGFVIMVIAYCTLLGLHEITVDSYTVIFKGIVYSVFFFLMVSFVEEIVCRGYILGQLLEKYNKYLALALSSIIFTGLHSFNPNMGTVPTLNLFFAGILLGITYIYTKNLWFPIALHFSWNFFQGPIFGFEVSGQKFYAIIQQTRLENNVLNGGNFGFEGSLIATILMLIAIFLIDSYYRQNLDV